MTLRTWTTRLSGLGIALALAACSSDPTVDDPYSSDVPGTGDPEGAAEFTSALPGASRGLPTAGDGSAGTGGSAAAPEFDEDAGGDGEAERAIAEADIIQVRGDRLYALSRSGGLSVIDISVRDELELLGRHRFGAEPFEMYVEGDVVYAMFTDWGQTEYVGDAATGYWNWVQSSALVALDVSEPANIEELATYRIPGAVSDSRLVGDVIYVVAHEDGYCWDCIGGAQTTIISVDVSDVTSPRLVDRATFADGVDGYSWGPRHVAATNERLYVAGPSYDWQAEEDWSSIQVIDISDPAGEMREAAVVKVHGQIESRWQMDEYEGVLRVISQPWGWWTDSTPVVETFAIASSDELTKLASLPLVLPRPESLMSARFDGPRGYAITFEQTDPLFTLDLTDPANPLQLGELEMPGFVWHMEPRGDRLFAIGYDNASSEGSLHVSLFDVSDMAEPKQLDRVHFGGAWGNFAEDQDRAHKAFMIDEEADLIAVPHSGTNEGGDGYWCYSGYQAVQLVDFTDTSLTKQGTIPQSGYARRAFLHDERLFTVSEERVETFDIADRSSPDLTASLRLTQNVDRTLVAGDKLVRLRAEWWSSALELDIVPLSDPERVEPLGELNLLHAAYPDGIVGNSCGDALGDPRVFALDEDTVAVVVASQKYTYYGWEDVAADGATGQADEETADDAGFVLVVDISDPTSPEVVSRWSLPFAWEQGYGYYGYYGYYGATAVGAPVTQVGDRLVFLERVVDAESGTYEAELHVVSFADPAAPAVTESFPLPTSVDSTGLLTVGTTVVWTQSAVVTDDPTAVRHYLGRLDVSNPDAPRRFVLVNVPGALLHWDPAQNQALLQDYQASVTQTTDSECYADYSAYTSYDYEAGTCVRYSQRLTLAQVGDTRAALLDSERRDDGYGGYFQVSPDRVYYTSNPEWVSDMWGYSSLYRQSLEVFGDAVGGRITSGTVEVESAGWSGSPVGKHYVLGGSEGQPLVLIDATDPTDLRTEELGTLVGYAASVTLTSDQAIVALGADGVQSLPRE